MPTTPQAKKELREAEKEFQEYKTYLQRRNIDFKVKRWNTKKHQVPGKKKEGYIWEIIISGDYDYKSSRSIWAAIKNLATKARENGWKTDSILRENVIMKKPDFSHGKFTPPWYWLILKKDVWVVV